MLIVYVYGEFFGVGGMMVILENFCGNWSKLIENCCKGCGEWNKYVVVVVDGCVKFFVNGKFVNGICDVLFKCGYFCFELEGVEIYF